MISKCGWQPGQHIFLQHLLVNSAIDLHFFNEQQGWFWNIRSSSSSSHVASWFLSIEMRSDTFRNGSWWSDVKPIILVVDHSLHWERLLIWSTEDFVCSKLHCMVLILNPLSQSSLETYRKYPVVFATWISFHPLFYGFNDSPGMDWTVFFFQCLDLVRLFAPLKTFYTH